MSLFCPDCRSTFQDDTLRVCPNDGTRLYVLDSSSSDDPLIGATIDGRFHIERSIGVGGMGTVYRAKQLSVGRDVAVKVLRAELSGKEVALERFFREAKTISQLTHPNIVRLIDFGQDREFDVLYLVMELVAGTNLGDLLRQGRLRVALALEIAYQVCGALTEPHAAGVIHRDLKPDNLLLLPVSDGTVQTKVLDFGIARALETNESTLTATGMICGTPAYMAPEQAQNEELDPRTDLYALGVILYEMLSGWPPFSGTSSLQIMLKHIQEAPVRLRELLPPATLPDEVEELVYALMHKDRDKRPNSAREVRDKIDDLRREFDFGRVRIDESNDVTDFLMRKLPRGEDGKSGPTEVLRRETGIEEMLTGHLSGADTGASGVDYARDTLDEMDHHTTFPFSADDDEVREDAKIKISTREGAQQAWTPGDQRALDRIKQTDRNFANDGVDAYGATELADGASVSQKLETDKPRKTMVEDPVEPADSESMVVRTAEKERETGERRPADTSDSRLPVAAQSESVSLPLVIAAAIALFVLGAAGVVLYQLNRMNNLPANPDPPVIVETTPKITNSPQREAAVASGVAQGMIVKTSAESIGANVLAANEEAEKAKSATTKKKSTKPTATTETKSNEKEPVKTKKSNTKDFKSEFEKQLGSMDDG